MSGSILRKITAMVFVLAMVITMLVSCGSERGTVWFYGNDVPDEAIEAEIGDFYMKTDTSDVYVLEENGWKLLANISGNDGANGATWLYGTSAPTAEEGQDGDFFLDTKTMLLYQKASGKWTSIAKFDK